MTVRRAAMNGKVRSQVTRFAVAVALTVAIHGAYAGTATWNLSPVNNRWNKAANWTPTTMPYGENDIATFGTSSVTHVMLGDTPDGYASNIVTEVSFAGGASAYTITLSPVTRQSVYATILTLTGAGITNNSGTVQSFVAARSNTKDSGRFYFTESASAGENVVITNEGADENDYGASTSFWDNSTATNVTIINEGSIANGTIYGGFTHLLDYSSAESAAFINNPGTVSGAAAGHTFVGTSPPGNIGTSTFINNAAAVPGARGAGPKLTEESQTVRPFSPGAPASLVQKGDRSMPSAGTVTRLIPPRAAVGVTRKAA